MVLYLKLVCAKVRMRFETAQGSVSKFLEPRWIVLSRYQHCYCYYNPRRHGCQEQYRGVRGNNS